MQTALMDGKFKHIQDNLRLMGITLNLTTTNEHVPRIERQIRVIKEQMRATRHTLQFKIIPKQMLITTVSNATMSLSAFPLKGGISDTLSLPTLITGVQFNFAKHCKNTIWIICASTQRTKPNQYTKSKDCWHNMPRTYRQLTTFL